LQKRILQGLHFVEKFVAGSQSLKEKSDNIFDGTLVFFYCSHV